MKPYLSLYFVYVPAEGEPIAETYLLEAEPHRTLLITFVRECVLAFMEKMGLR